jgi:hypothetical protein
MVTSISEGDIHLMAVGCFYINVQKAAIDFPSTTRAKPSQYVVVYPSAGKLIREGDKVYFPFKVLWNVWHQIVLPVLRDPRYQFRDPRTGREIPLNMALLRLGDYDTVIRMYEDALTAKFQEEGFIPGGVGDSGEDSIPTGVESSGDGEPIVVGGTNTTGNPEFPTVDLNEFWSEGHLKLVYPLVDA